MRETMDPRSLDDRELRLLIECARASIDPAGAARIRELAAGGLDWTRLQRLAERHGLRPLLYWHLNTIGAAGVPAESFAFLRDCFQRNAALTALLTGELVRLLALLHDHGVEAMPLKGPAAAVALYGHVARRQFYDLDILVRARDVWRASEAIERQGFEADCRIRDEWRDAYLRHGYVREYRRDGGRTVVELHWDIAERFFGVRFDADGVWRRSRPMTLQGRAVHAPSDEDLMLMLCVHGSRHGWSKLEGLSGLAELARRDTLDWAFVWRTAREMRCQRMLAFALRLAQSLLGSPLPPEAAALSDSRAYPAVAGEVIRDFSVEVPQSRSAARQRAIHLRLMDTYADRARYWVGLAFTETPDDWATVRLRGPLSLGYPLVRALRVARKHAGDQHEAAGGRP
jgi:hypothetical protein